MKRYGQDPVPRDAQEPTRNEESLGSMARMEKTFICFFCGHCWGMDAMDDPMLLPITVTFCFQKAGNVHALAVLQNGTHM